MRLTIIAAMLCVCASVSAGELSHLRAKARLVGRLVGKHHKRGVLSAVPPFKLGHDIPHVTHSVVKPVVVTYPPTASVTAVKVPLAHPLLPKYPLPVGHRVPVPHPHYGLKFPHHHTKAVVLPKPDQHYHHHHHHVAPRPLIPVSPVVPIPGPTIVRPIPVPSPPVVLPTQVVHPAPVPTPVHVQSEEHVHLRPVLPAPVAAPVLNYAPQIPYVLRPGNAIQTSFFANYPRYPFLNYQGPVFPLGASSFSQIVPHVPQYPVSQQGAYDGVVVEQPSVQLEPTPTLVHAYGEVPQPAVHLEPQPAVHVHAAQPELHLQPGHPDIHLQHPHPGVHLPSAQPDIHLQPGIQLQQPGVHLHGTQPDIHLQPGVQVNGPPDGHHFDAGQPGLHLQPGVQIQPGQPDIHFQAAQPGSQFQAGVQVNAARQPDIHFHQGQPSFYQPGQTDFYQPGQTDFHQPGQIDFHLQPNQPQPTQPTVDLNGWSPVTSQNDLGLPNGQYPNDAHHQFVQDQGHHQFDQGQHQFGQDHGQQNFNQGQDQFGQDQSQHHFNQGQDQFGQDQNQKFDHGHHQFQDQDHQGYDQNAQDGYSEYQNQLQQHIQQQLEQAQYERLNPHQAGDGAPPAQQYGAEGRSAEGADEPGDAAQLYHNHIPLGLQPPLDRPLDHFR